jgi:predicted ATP-binding protein involved in virulence
MEIRKIRLNNVGRFTDLEVAFAPTDKHASKVTVFVGNNGAGKTTILKSIATSLSWLVGRIRTDNGGGSPIQEDVVTNGERFASIDAEVGGVPHPSASASETYSWTLARTLRGHKAKVNSSLSKLTALSYRAD